MSDKRKDTRKKLMAFTPVYDFISHALLGYVGDINQSGVMVVGEHAAEIGNQVILNIDLPDGLVDVTEKTLLLPARTAWCKPEEAVKSFTIGFEFTGITTKQEEVIQAILNRYHFRYGSE